MGMELSALCSAHRCTSKMTSFAEVAPAAAAAGVGGDSGIF